MTAMINSVDIDHRQGNLYEPVAGERFDLITIQPALRDLSAEC